MTGLRLEKADLTDAEAVFELNREAVLAYEDSPSVDKDKALLWIRKDIGENIGKYRRILFGEEKAGYVRLDDLGDKWFLDDLFLFPSFRGKGIGTALLSEHLKNAGKPTELFVFIRNTGARRFYERLGFTEAASIRDSRIRMRCPPSEISGKE